ncbi:hypothetical protein, partial [Chryseobacterium rhizosphaerae]|uniref:hypothetical protein n=1 Tax=Chryseobacterium rhizosphaerae TaxID=395937 RepID=UPI003D0E8C48
AGKRNTDKSIFFVIIKILPEFTKKNTNRLHKTGVKLEWLFLGDGDIRFQRADFSVFRLR